MDQSCPLGMATEPHSPAARLVLYFILARLHTVSVMVKDDWGVFDRPDNASTPPQKRTMI